MSRSKSTQTRQDNQVLYSSRHQSANKEGVQVKRRKRHLIRYGYLPLRKLKNADYSETRRLTLQLNFLFIVVYIFTLRAFILKHSSL